MEGVENIEVKETEHGNHKVEHVVEEGAILNEKPEVEHIVLKSCKNISELWFFANIEFGCFRTLEIFTYIALP